MDADSIREYVEEEYIEPARARGERTFTVRTGDVADAMGLQKRLPAVCTALGANKFEDDCGVKRTACEGPLNGANLRLTFRILD